MAGPLSWRLGTMGFGYPDWAGPFYPAGMKPGEYLPYYARFFDAVELDTTFHATPPPERVRHWAASTPDHFRFCAKAPREVTHDAPLSQSGPAMERFLGSIGQLGEKLSVVLLQFAPSFTAERAGDLGRFLERLPPDGPVRFAVELRSRSWGTEATLDLLRERRCCLVSAEYVTRPRALHATTDFLYLRWVGEHGRFDSHGREQADPTPQLEWWKAQLATPPAGVGGAFGFFNNDYAGSGVATCNRFKRLMGLPAREPTASDRGELFG